MTADNLSRDVPSIAAAYDWSARGHVYDLGGGSGVLLAGLLAALERLAAQAGLAVVAGVYRASGQASAVRSLIELVRGDRAL